MRTDARMLSLKCTANVSLMVISALKDTRYPELMKCRNFC